MGLNIAVNGIVHRGDDGACRIVIPGRHGGRATFAEVPEQLADEHRLSSGDVVHGRLEPIENLAEAASGPEPFEDLDNAADQIDEPTAARGISVPSWLYHHSVPTLLLTAVTSINGLDLEAADERPRPRRRLESERILPDRCLTAARGNGDLTGAVLDFAAPLGAGSAGIAYGPHGAGLTRTLLAVARGVAHNHPDVQILVLLVRTRSEEATAWRRYLPDADIIVCPSAGTDTDALFAIEVADLTLACAQRISEQGKDVLLIADSLTGLWSTLLEAEGADDQAEADKSHARHLIRTYLQAAGCFRGAGLLGSGIGGSLTILGSVWQKPVDIAAEEDRESNPQLRLLETVLHDTSWRVPLSANLAAEGLFPAIDVPRCYSAHEERLLSPDAMESLYAQRSEWAALEAPVRFQRMAAL